MFHMDLMFFQPMFQGYCVFHRRTGMADDDVGNDLTFESGRAQFFEILFGKGFKALDRRLAHQFQHIWRAMLRSQFQPTPGIFGRNGFDVAFIAQNQVVADAAGDKYMLDIRKFGDCIQQMQLRFVIQNQIGTDLRENAGAAGTAIGKTEFTIAAIHIRAGSANIADGPF